ncbi:MAG TPA: response regulator [Flavitalea sp.]|nr:response regulator [Flavitalea sp.]
MSQLKPRSRLIYIADDDPDDLDLYQEIIGEIPGNCILCFSDGKYLFDHLVQADPNELPDLIILDINMPLWTGQKTVAAIREIERLRSIRIVIITTSRYEQDKAMWRNLNIPMYTKASSYSDVKELFFYLLASENHSTAQKF